MNPFLREKLSKLSRIASASQLFVLRDQLPMIGLDRLLYILFANLIAEMLETTGPPPHLNSTLLV